MAAVSEVVAAARGRWVEILRALAPELHPALERLGRHVPCPRHGGRDGFRLFRDAPESGGGICNTCGAFPSGWQLLGWLRGWSFEETVQAVADCLGGERLVAALPRARPPVPRLHDPQWRRAKLRDTWAGTVPLDDPLALPVRRYLIRRGLMPRGLLPRQVAATGALRCHPALPYWEDGEVVGRFPALVAVVAVCTAAGFRPVTVHRTYLTREGDKAPVPQVKKLMPAPEPLRGVCVPLAAPGPVLGVAEGIETALAVILATGLPVWATLSATVLERFQPPPGVRRVIVWADRDRSRTGERAARRLQARLWRAGIPAAVQLPPGPIPEEAKGIDWNDVLRQHGVDAFPLRYRPMVPARREAV